MKIDKKILITLIIYIILYFIIVISLHPINTKYIGDVSNKKAYISMFISMIISGIILQPLIEKCFYKYNYE